MTDRVTYELDDGIATITMDDGKANVMSLSMIAALSAAFHQAEADRAVTILTGRSTIFSAGYDTAIFQQPGEEITATLRAGGDLVHQLLAHPLPVVAACNGHAIAQGAFTLLACDVRIGVSDSVKVGLNEVMIGLTIPHYGVEVARYQLAPAWFDRATVTGTLFDPQAARRAGFLHETVERDAVIDVARHHATALTSVDHNAHAGTKQHARRDVLQAVRQGIDQEFPA